MAAPTRLSAFGPAPPEEVGGDPHPVVADPEDGVAAITVEAARRLKASGADGLLLASATMHKVEGAVAAHTGLPVLHIADATAENLVAAITGATDNVVTARAARHATVKEQA